MPTGEYRHAYERAFELSEAELARRGKSAKRQRTLEARPAEPEKDLFTGE